jgi:hypothetical protein
LEQETGLSLPDGGVTVKVNPCWHTPLALEMAVSCSNATHGPTPGFPSLNVIVAARQKSGVALGRQAARAPARLSKIRTMIG